MKTASNEIPTVKPRLDFKDKVDGDDKRKSPKRQASKSRGKTKIKSLGSVHVMELMDTDLRQYVFEHHSGM